MTMLDQDSSSCACYGHEPAVFDRPELWVSMIIVMFAGVGLLFVIANLPFGIQIGSLIPYTAFVTMGTFSAQRRMQPYFFECPIVKQTMPRLLLRHGGFVAGMVLLETIAIYLTRYMPTSWLIADGRDGSPFAISLCVICVCLGCVEVFTNRSLLERAHARKRQEA